MNHEDFTYVILAGGDSRRMKQNKAELMYRGRSFLETLGDKGVEAGFNHILVSGYGVSLPWATSVPDLLTHRGPLGGFHACFKESSRPYCLVTSVDVPHISPNTFKALADYHARSGKQATLLSQDGQIEPLIGVYNSDLYPLIESIIHDHSASVWKLLDLIDYAVLPYIGEISYRSINTSEDYDALLQIESGPENDSKRPLIVAIGGAKNSGKTTLIVKLIPLIQKRGYRVATIKHHHSGEFEVDVPGKDTYRQRKAGAYATAMYSPSGFMVYKQQADATPESLAAIFPEVDLILLEGFHLSSYRKLEVIRGERSRGSITNPENRLAIATDIPDLEYDDIKLSLNDPDLIADFLCAILIQEPGPVGSVHDQLVSELKNG